MYSPNDAFWKVPHIATWVLTWTTEHSASATAEPKNPPLPAYFVGRPFDVEPWLARPQRLRAVGEKNGNKNEPLLARRQRLPAVNSCLSLCVCVRARASACVCALGAHIQRGLRQCLYTYIKQTNQPPWICNQKKEIRNLELYRAVYVSVCILN